MIYLIQEVFNSRRRISITPVCNPQKIVFIQIQIISYRKQVIVNLLTNQTLNRT